MTIVVDQEMIKGRYLSFSKDFRSVIDKHAPIKHKIIRGNNAPFMTKELRKAIMDRSRYKNKYLKFPSRENFLNMKKVKNKCNSLCRKTKINYFKKCTENGISSYKKFWNFIKPFLTNKGTFSNDFITIKKGDGFIVS